MSFKISFVSKRNKVCLRFDLKSVCVCLYSVNMGLTLSMPRIDFYLYHLIARNVTIPSSEITLLREKFFDRPGSMLDKLKVLQSEVFSVVRWGRLVVFLNFAERQGLTGEEWEQLFHFLFLTLSQIQE